MKSKRKSQENEAIKNLMNQHCQFLADWCLIWNDYRVALDGDSQSRVNLCRLNSQKEREDLNCYLCGWNSWLRISFSLLQIVFFRATEHAQNHAQQRVWCMIMLEDFVFQERWLGGYIAVAQSRSCKRMKSRRMRSLTQKDSLHESRE